MGALVVSASEGATSDGATLGTFILSKWLRTRGLAQYTAAFEALGATSLDDLQFLESGDLASQGVAPAEAKLVEVLIAQLLVAEQQKRSGSNGSNGGGVPSGSEAIAATAVGVDADAMARAITVGDFDAVSRMLRGGYPANLGVGDVPPLFAAALRGDARLVALVADAGAHLDVGVASAGGAAALAAAAQLGHLAAVEALLERGAACDAQRLDGATALFAAAEAGRTRVVRALCASGASAAIARVSDGATPLTIASELGRFDVASALLEDARTEIDVNARLVDGATALFLAAQGGYAGLVRLLLDNGAQLRMARSDGCTPLLIARQCRHYVVARALEGASERERSLALSAAASTNESELLDLAATLRDMAVSPSRRSGGGGSQRRLGPRPTAAPLDAREVSTLWGGASPRQDASPRRARRSPAARRAERDQLAMSKAAETLLLANVLGPLRGPLSHEIADARRVLKRGTRSVHASGAAAKRSGNRSSSSSSSSRTSARGGRRGDLAERQVPWLNKKSDRLAMTRIHGQSPSVVRSSVGSMRTKGIGPQPVSRLR